MRTQRILAMLALSLLASATAFAECKPRPLDLASGDTTLLDSALAGQGLCFELLNGLPDATYKREIHKVPVEIPPLPTATLASGQALIKALTIRQAVPATQCTEAEANRLLANLNQEMSEKKIPAHRAALSKLLPTLSDPNCIQNVINALGRLQPRGIPGEFPVAAGEQITVTVTREKLEDPPGNARWGEKTWKFVFSTGPRGEWNASYGFAFLPERNEEFFAKEQDDDTFVVTRQSESSDVDVEPVVFFTWTSAKRQGKAWTWGPTAGLGIDLSKPTLFAGYSWTYNRNITFITGAGVHQRSRLDGTFEEGQVLEQSLTPDQLEDDEGFGVSGFVGVTLRFGKNPFKGGGDDSKDKGNGGSGGDGGGK